MIVEPKPHTKITLDPVEFVKLVWPDLTLYKEQKEILYSLRDNYETMVPAGNELGKDFTAAIGALWFFCTRRPAKVVTTSPQAGQLEDVLWGELRRLIDSAKVKLPIAYNHMKIRQVRNDGSFEPRSELVGRVVQKGESLLGRHIERGPHGLPTTLIIFDEASGMDDTAYDTADTWTHRKLIIGNCYPCTNFFYRGVKGGSKLSENLEDIYYRKVIRIKAEHSPNVRLALAQKEAGLPITHETLVPGVVRYSDYLQRRSEWDQMRQCIGLDAEFYEGDEVKLFPPTRLAAAQTLWAEEHQFLKNRKALAMGIDPAEGGDSTSIAIVDALGLIELVSLKTPDTSDIPNLILGKAKQYNLDLRYACIDRGGGGKQHADQLRKRGHKIQTIGFGESASGQIERNKTLKKQKEDAEERYTYKNRRAEMAHRASLKLKGVYSIPQGSKYDELVFQLKCLPLLYDEEGRIYLPPKNKKPNSKIQCLVDLIGHSPDEADALMLAEHALYLRNTRKIAGAIDV